MKKILNAIFNFLKYLLLIIAFAITLYIVLFMYKRVDRNIIESVDIFIPYLLLCIVLMINSILKQTHIKDNLFYNLTCCFVFITTIIVGVRALIDTNMVLNSIMGYNINFSYFSDYLSFMKMMMYGLIISNLMFMIKEKTNTNLKEDDIEVL